MTFYGIVYYATPPLIILHHSCSDVSTIA